MKKIVCLLGLILLVGCGDDADTTRFESTEPADEVAENEREQEGEVEEEESHDHESEGEDDVEEKQSQEVIEKIEKKYTINATTSAVQPIEGMGADENVVLITIDDAPDNYSIEMAKNLKKLEVPAIFFVNGHFIMDEAGRDKLKEIYEMGFEIGNHTMTHPNLQQISEEEQKNEIVELNELVEEIIGERPRFFRAPFGANTDYAREVVADEQMTLMNWTYGYDWESNYQNADALTDIMVNAKELQNGANLLMHDRAWTAEALTDIINGLQEKGYKMVNPKEIK
ncbi:polysaccharide deacetylase [Alkalihalobacillus alcalophilus ATCC 27647 = CGMCC 1.3604]|uniref:Polysaccharide deacetylase n=1 Tax=Alkalihalobacillus alcalophilus ATCC 27647 = CGMCC 1.3604 TaxID=1218173 RepID=A0A094WM86_ALKAL|nr:polysaccharide deacetylase family protein [Alkalihalobacillus alcalophilus]KGA98854.1 polysaccharide deacetylase [Alkalihalobacillus alcalophilus ATCC 27647 = CGMCC 1.3604]MED1564265.1 polysaccharide deacetylase family protein [Alkalihalobacillus alcalophilus]THG91024.1 polysaccharide deacetylase [Alkalihalobacillus alcalophilus ATCC 27647 = CGMCC 1.3604]